MDVCVTTVTYTGARALWQVDALEELYCAFAEPHAVRIGDAEALEDALAVLGDVEQPPTTGLQPPPISRRTVTRCNDLPTI